MSEFEDALNKERHNIVGRNRIIIANPQGGGNVSEIDIGPNLDTSYPYVYFHVRSYRSLALSTDERPPSEVKEILTVLKKGEVQRVAYGLLSAIAESENANQALSLQGFHEFMKKVRP